MALSCLCPSVPSFSALSDDSDPNSATFLLIGSLVIGHVGDHDIATILVLIVVVAVFEGEGAVRVELIEFCLVLHMLW